MPSERSHLLSSNHTGEDEKYVEYQCFGIYSEKAIVLTGDDRRRRIGLRIFVAITVFLVVGTWLLHSRWIVERICHRNGICTFDQMTPESIVDAPQTPDDKHPNIIKDTPQYVLDYAPYVYLHKDEEFWPSTMEEHFLHSTPALNYTPIQKDELQAALNLSNLDQLNAFERGRNVFLTSDDDVEDRPDWLGSAQNIPEAYPSPKNEHSRWFGTDSRSKDKKATGSGGRSQAPAILITVDKGNGIVDAFWFFFYSYNLGNIVLNIRWGNHVGDWEHTMVRFQHGQPRLVFYSEHSFGAAYSYSAVEKIADNRPSRHPQHNRSHRPAQRPVAYSAIGSHAMYATSGSQPYILPLGMLHDTTSRGPLWDPSLNLLAYSYHPSTDILTPSTLNPSSPTAWFFFNGKWGDKSYPLSDRRQYGIVGEWHYVNGPLGPRFKNLGRRKVCQGRYEDPCVIRHWLAASSSSSAGDGEVDVKSKVESERKVPVVESIGEGEDWPVDVPELMPVGLLTEDGSVTET